MVIIHVQHFLTEEGRKFFPTFVSEMRKAMIEYNKGFISLRRVQKEGKEEENHFILEYENYELLKEFSKTEPHVKLIEKLKTFQEQKQTVEKFYPQ